MEQTGKKRIWWDLALILGLLIISGILFLCFTGKETGAYVLVRVDGEETGKYFLNQSGTYKLNGGTNILEIEDGQAYLSEANCPDKICIKMGKINLNGQCITCLPNKLTVTVYGAEDGVDIVG